MYFISSWICTNSRKNLFVKIVYPGGRVEIHDDPIQAAELLKRNPECCVFCHPYGVVSPTTTLALGRKYCIVPIRKLQINFSASQSKPAYVDSYDHKQKKKEGDKMEHSSSGWLIRNNKNGLMTKSVEARNGGTRSSFGHWKPVLESIIE